MDQMIGRPKAIQREPGTRQNSVACSVILRHVPVFFLAVWFHPAGREALDWVVAETWRTLHSFHVLHIPLAEAIVATLGFWVAGCFFETLHLWSPAARKARLGGGGRLDRSHECDEAGGPPTVATFPLPEFLPLDKSRRVSRVPFCHCHLSRARAREASPRRRRRTALRRTARRRGALRNRPL